MGSIPPIPPYDITPSPPSPPQAMDPEATLRADKLKLEIKELEERLSKRNRIFEYFKAWASPVATAITTVLTLGALIWTIRVGIVQLHQTQNAQDQDRFDKAISRLGSSSVNERLTGVAGLSLFLTKGQEDRHGATLRFLGAALVIEDNQSVRSAILDTFRHVDSEFVDQKARDEGLRTLIESNRATLDELRRGVPEGSANDYLVLAPNPKFRSQITSLRAASDAIAVLAKKNTAERDFTNIYCAGCDFSGTGTVDLSDARFDQSILDHANFSGVLLSDASFHKASLLGTNFQRATLRGAHFTGSPDGSYTVQYFRATGERPEAPDLACSDLSRVDFAGSLFFGVVESNDPSELIAAYPDLFGANLSDADLSGISFYSLHLKGPRSALPPFSTPNQNLHAYHPNSLKGDYRILTLSPTSDWTFTASSGPFRNSWRYLLSKLRSARNVNTARLPNGLRNFEREGNQPALPAGSAYPCQP